MLFTENLGGNEINEVKKRSERTKGGFEEGMRIILQKKGKKKKKETKFITE